MTRFWTLFWLASRILVPAAHAEGSAPAELDTLVITASRSRSTLRDMPANVSVVPRESIEDAAPRSLEDALPKAATDADLQGSAVAQSRLRGITLRGVSDQARTLILLDGVPLNEPRVGNVVWQMVDPESVDRVEIIRGPNSSLYGAGAMGGVVNIITRTPERPNEARAGVSYGELGSQSFHFAQGGRDGKFTYLLSGRSYHTDGYIAEKFPQSYNVPRYRDQRNFQTKLSYEPETGSKLAGGLLLSQDKLDRGRTFFTLAPTDAIGYLSYSREGERGAFLARTHLNYENNRREEDKAPSYNFLNGIANDRGRMAGATVQGSYDWRDGAKLTAGLDGKYTDMRDEMVYQTVSRVQRERGRQLYAAPFLELQIKLLEEKLVSTLGGRFDWFRSYGGSYEDTSPASYTTYAAKAYSAFDPRLGLLYRLGEKTTLRAASGRAFRAPTPFNLNSQQLLGTTLLLGNPGLGPEYLWSYEAGVDRKWRDDLQSKLTFYQGWARDLIAHNSIGGTTRQYNNLSSVDMSGVEAELDWRATKELSASAGYSYERSVVAKDSSKPQTVGNYFTYTPRNKVSLGARFERPSWFGAAANLRYKDIMYADVENTILSHSYWDLDLGFWRRFAKHMIARVDVENVLNNKYDIFDFTQPILTHPGRIVTASLRVEF